MAASHLLGEGARVGHFDDLLALLCGQNVSLAQLVVQLLQHFDDRLRFGE